MGGASSLLRCCGGLCGGHFSTPGGHLSCVNQPWRPHCWDHPAPTATRALPATGGGAWGRCGSTLPTFPACGAGGPPSMRPQWCRRSPVSPSTLTGSGSVLQRQSSSLEEREVLAAAPVMNDWDTIQREGKPILQLLENFLGTQGRKQKCPMQVR